MAPVAVNTALSPLQILSDGETATDTDAETAAFTTMVIPLDVAVGADAHDMLEVSTTFTTSLFDKVEVEKISELAPAGWLFIYHWYDGVLPPLVGVAVNVTLVPLQIVLLPLDATLTEGVRLPLTVTVIGLLLAVVGLAHDELLVNTQVITSPFANALSLYVAPVPTLLLFFFH